MDSNQPTSSGLQPPMPGQGDGADAASPIGPAQTVAGAAMAQAMEPAQVTEQISTGESEELDQEWVEKAKDIVEKTKNDPFTQSRELSKVKAGYLKARYNKELKIDEDSA